MRTTPPQAQSSVNLKTTPPAAQSSVKNNNISPKEQGMCKTTAGHVPQTEIFVQECPHLSCITNLALAYAPFKF